MRIKRLVSAVPKVTDIEPDVIQECSTDVVCSDILVLKIISFSFYLVSIQSF